MAGGADKDGPRRRLSRRPEPTPGQRALALLVRREHSRPELLRKLQARGIDRGDAVAAVERMAAEGWQDDGRFAESLARARANAGYGPRYIRAELAMHGLATEVVDTALHAYAGEWPAVAARAVQRRCPRAFEGDRVQRDRALAWLSARGFSREQAIAALASPGDVTA